MVVLGEVAAPRSVSLYWSEKLWLLLDALQLLHLLGLCATSALPFQWGRRSRVLGIFLLDFSHAFSRELLETNTWGSLPLGAIGRIIFIAVLLIIAFLSLGLSNRAKQAVAAHRRREEQEALQKQLQIQQQKSLVKTRPSVTAMLVDAMRPGAASTSEKLKQKQVEACRKLRSVFLSALDRVLLLRVPLGLLLLPCLAANLLPFVFCSDQSESCSFSGLGYALLAVRIAGGLGAAVLFGFSAFRMQRRLSESVVSLRSRQQEAFVKQQELEYLLHLTENWEEQQTWLVSSFRGGLTGAPSRLALFFLKILLSCVFSIFGQTSAKAPTGLHWLSQQIPSDFNWSRYAAALHAQSLGAAISAEPFGRAAMAAVGAGLLCTISVILVLLPPYRCRSSNCMHVAVYLHLIGVASVALASAGGNTSSSILLPTNLVRLLLCLHCFSVGVLLAILTTGVFRCFLPQESPELLHYEAILGFRAASPASSNAATEKATRRHLTDQRRNCCACVNNLGIVIRRGLRSLLRRLKLREALEHFDRSWSFLSSSALGSWLSDSDDSLNAGELQLGESAFVLPPFQAPWPLLPQHARFCIRVAPDLVEALAASQQLLRQMAAADKSLVPLHVVNQQFQSLSKLVERYIGRNDIRQQFARKVSERRSLGQFLKGEDQQLQDLLKELQMHETQVGGTEDDEADGNADERGRGNSQRLSRTRLPWKSRFSQSGTATESNPQQPVAFVQQSQTVARWSALQNRTSASSSAVSDEDEEEEQDAKTFDFARLQHMAFMSKEFAPLKLKRLKHLQTVVEAFRFCVIDIFQKLSALQKAVAENSICRETHKEALKSRRLLQELSVHLNRRNRRMLLVPPKLRRILFKLLAIRYVTASVNSSRRDWLLMQERRKNQIELFGEESSVVFFTKEDDMFGEDEDFD